MTPLDPGRRGSYAFGLFRLAADGTLLEHDGVPVALEPKVLRTLLVMVEHAGRVVTKAELLQAVWPDSFVEETGLARNVSLLRQALGDEAQALVVTVPRIGYRFVGPVTLVNAPGAAAPAMTDAHGARPAEERHPEPAKPTRLLILPFRVWRDDPDTGFLAFSVPDAVVSALSGLESLVVRSSAVAARLAAEPPDLQRIADEANVDAVVTGTLVRSGPQIRISAQLLAVPSGTVRWAGSFEVTQRDVFVLQDRLVAQIVAALALSLTPRERRRLSNDVPASPAAYEWFLRANEAVGPQGLASSSDLRVARELYALAIEADPHFAPAWVRLGRCHYLLGKSGEARDENVARAEACFQRGLELNPDLPIAHNLYALFEIDQGRARSAMARLIARGLGGSAQPELYAALVQACRFCGLLEASLAAHECARALDPEIPTGGYQTLWQLGDEDGALREGIRPWVLEALITGMRGDPGGAIELIRRREQPGVTSYARHLLAGLRAVFEGHAEAAIASATQIFDAFPDPEAVYYAARYLAFFGEPRAIVELGRALDRGFVTYRVLLKDDPWLDALRSTPEFQALLERSRERYRECLATYVEAGGERLLGPVPGPGHLEPGVAPIRIRRATTTDQDFSRFSDPTPAAPGRAPAPGRPSRAPAAPRARPDDG